MKKLTSKQIKDYKSLLDNFDNIDWNKPHEFGFDGDEPILICDGWIDGNRLYINKSQLEIDLKDAIKNKQFRDVKGRIYLDVVTKHCIKSKDTPKTIVINPIGSITNGKNYEVHFRIKELLISYKNSYSFKFIVSSVNDFNNLKSLIVDEMGFDFQVIERDKQYDFLSKEYGLNNFYYISSSSLDEDIKQDCYRYYSPYDINEGEAWNIDDIIEPEVIFKLILSLLIKDEDYVSGYRDPSFI